MRKVGDNKGYKAESHAAAIYDITEQKHVAKAKK